MKKVMEVCENTRLFYVGKRDKISYADKEKEIAIPNYQTFSVRPSVTPTANNEKNASTNESVYNGYKSYHG